MAPKTIRDLKITLKILLDPKWFETSQLCNCYSSVDQDSYLTVRAWLQRWRQRWAASWRSWPCWRSTSTGSLKWGWTGQTSSDLEWAKARARRPKLIARPSVNKPKTWKSPGPIFNQAWQGPKLERWTKLIFLWSKQGKSEPKSLLLQSLSPTWAQNSKLEPTNSEPVPALGRAHASWIRGHGLELDL